jgi:hypothetical protein
MVDYHQTIAICSLNWDLGRNGIDTIQIRNILWSESMGRKFDILAKMKTVLRQAFIVCFVW